MQGWERERKREILDRESVKAKTIQTSTLQCRNLFQKERNDVQSNMLIPETLLRKVQ